MESNTGETESAIGNLIGWGQLIIWFLLYHAFFYGLPILIAISIWMALERSLHSDYESDTYPYEDVMHE
jgi:hypothetical protein